MPGDLALCAHLRAPMLAGVKRMAEPAKRAAKKVEPAPSLAGRIKTAPKLSAPDEAHARVAQWLGEIARGGAGKAIRHLLAPAKGNSKLVDRAGLSADNDDHAMRALRRGKAEAALLIALADIGGVWPVERVTRALTELADTAVRAAVRFLLREAAARGRLKPADVAKPEEGSRHIVLAMGKMGAFELNYSSDIDLIVFYDPAAPALADKDDATAFHVRIARGL